MDASNLLAAVGQLPAAVRRVGAADATQLLVPAVVLQLQAPSLTVTPDGNKVATRVTCALSVNYEGSQAGAWPRGASSRWCGRAMPVLSDDEDFEPEDAEDQDEEETEPKKRRSGKGASKRADARAAGSARVVA